MPGLVGMGDCAGDGTPCKTKVCTPPTTVDVIVDNRRVRLRSNGHSGVWTSSEDFGSSGSQNAYAKSFDGTLVMSFYGDGSDDGLWRLCTVEIGTGEVLDTLTTFAFDPGNDGGFWGLTQEASVSVGYQPSTDATGTELSKTITPEGVIDDWVVGQFGGMVRVGEKLYALETLTKRISRCEVSPDAGEVWKDLSTFFDLPVWMLFDDDLQLFYVIGFDDDGFIRLYSIDTGGSETLLTTLAETGHTITAFTLLSDGLWFVSHSRVYNRTDANFEVVLERTAGSWPDMTGSSSGLQAPTVGAAFVVGVSETCDQACACGPTIELTRVFDDLPGGSGDCGGRISTEDYEDLQSLQCFHRFAYTITLCEGRTLKEIVFQGQRGVLFIEDVGPVSEITDWSLVPLEGFLFFQFSNGCGPHAGTLRVTIIDSENCCDRVLVPLECCTCCPPSGGYSLAPDVAEEFAITAGWALEGDPAACDSGDAPGFGYVDGCEACFCRNYWEWWQITFGEATPSDCGALDEFIEDLRPCYRVEWGGAQPRDGDPALPPFVRPGDTVRFRVQVLSTDCNPTPVCIRIWVADALGGDECVTFLGAEPFFNNYVVPCGTDPELFPECVQAKNIEWQCTEDGVEC